MKKLFFLIVMVILTIAVPAQAPQKISYQAVIRNSSGQLIVSHSVEMKISILQGSAAGTAVYVEIQTPTTNSNGLVTVEIGGGTLVSGTFEGIDWSSGTYFIKTEAVPAGGTNYSITGSSQILSVPYAIHSKTAENAATKSYVDNLIETVKGVLSGNKVIDRDGNIYNTVLIGNQLWMAENLRTTKYNDGTPIAKVSDNTWRTLTTGAYCWYENDSATYEIPYGKLYNFYAIYIPRETQKICPVGWHVPTNTEWGELITFLGGIKEAGGKLKETGTVHWRSRNEGATNETGFTALPGGIRPDRFAEIRERGYWWTSTPHLSSNNAYSIHLIYSSKEAFPAGSAAESGLSVRCLKDS